MEMYSVWKDGEEVEVGWLEMMLDRLRDFLKNCKRTDWKHYFRGNGPGEVTWLKFSEWRESPNYANSCAQWLIRVEGGIRPKMGNTYYRNVTACGMTAVQAEASGQMKAMADHAKDILMLYAEPDCTCRLGYHRKCPHHFKTKD